MAVVRGGRGTLSVSRSGHSKLIFSPDLQVIQVVAVEQVY